MYMTAQEAADELGVSLATLYAYVSRKNIRTRKVANSRSRQYWREDIESLKGVTPASTGDVLVPSTTITLITAEGPFYRGQSAIGLAETPGQTLETVSELLWGTDSARAFNAGVLNRPNLYDKVLAELDGASVSEKACALLPILEKANPRAYDMSPSGYCRTGAEVMRWFASLVCETPNISNTPIHEQIAAALDAEGRYADLIRRLLILGADHELDPTTYAVRAVANTGVSAYHIVVAGMTSSVGRRLSFGRSEGLSALLAEIMTAPDPEEPILRRVREGEAVYGFGSRVYPAGDPRAQALLAWLEEVDGDVPDYRRLKAAIRVAADVLGLPPDFVLPLGYVGRRLGQIGRETVLLRLARISGWIAHALEQYHSENLMRPRTVYRGILPA